MSRVWSQYKALLRRNYLLKIRDYRSTAGEIILPLLVFFFLMSFKSLQPAIHYESVVPNLDSRIELDDSSITQFFRIGKLFYSPANNDSNHYVEQIITQMKSNIANSYSSAYANLNIIGLKQETDIEEFYQRKSQVTQSANANLNNFWAALVFDIDPAQRNVRSLPNDVQYYIRFNGSYIPSTASKEQIIARDYQHSKASQRYIESGFISLQNAVNKAILAVKISQQKSTTSKIKLTFDPATNTDDSDLLNIHLNFAKYPTRAYESDSFHDLLISTGPLYLVIGFFPIIQKLVTLLVMEKEKNIRDVMLVMSLRKTVYYLSWYLTYSLLTLLPLLIMCTMAYSFEFYTSTSIAVVFLLLFLYLQSLIILAILISLFFRSAKLAAQVSGSLIFVLFLPQYFLNNNHNEILLRLAEFSSPIAFSQGFKAVADAELHRIPLNLASLTQDNAVYKDLQISMQSLLINCFLYAFLAYYYENLAAKHWFWAGELLKKCRNWRNRADYELLLNENLQNQRQNTENSYNGAENGYKDPEQRRPRLESPPVIEPRLENTQISANQRISIANCTKFYQSNVFSRYSTRFWHFLSCRAAKVKANPANSGDCTVNSAGETIAINNFSLTLAQGEITVLLGHNGAGKSTLFNVLSGLTAPNSGEITIFGQNLTVSTVEEIRTNVGIGICPQNDILFDNLTVLEHLLYYGGLKNMEKQQILTEIRPLLTELALLEKIDEAVSKLSGGQKRKLCFLIALLGENRLILLDECSCGIDPVSRRVLWQVLKRYKRDCAIFLSTHSLEEAENLADKLAIMAQGRLKCCGTTLFLKNKCGAGYKLDIIIENQQKIEEIGQVVRKFVQKMKQKPLNRYVKQRKAQNTSGVGQDEHGISINSPGSSENSEKNMEIGYMLPLNELSAYSALFSYLETHKAELSIVNFSVTATSLEEVYLNMTKSDEETEVNPENELEIPEISLNSAESKEIEMSSISSPHSLDKNQLIARKAITSRLIRQDSDSGDSNFEEEQANSSEKSRLSSQLRAMFMKRRLLFTRDKRSVFIQVVFPLIYSVILLLILAGLDLYNYQSPPGLDLFATYSFDALTNTSTVQEGPYSRLFEMDKRARLLPYTTSSASVANTIEPKLLEWLSLPQPYSVSVPANTNQPAEAFKSLMDYLSMPGHESYAAFYIDNSRPKDSPDSNPLTITVLTNSSAVHAPPIVVNMIYSALYNKLCVDELNFHKASHQDVNILNTCSIQAINRPFSFASDSLMTTSSSLIIALMIGLAFSYLPINFGVLIVKEKHSNILHLQRISGLKSAVFWLANLLCDFAIYCIPVTGCFILFAAFGSDVLFSINWLGSILLFMLFGLAIILFTYLLTFRFKQHENFNIILSLLYGVVTLIIFALAISVASTMDSTTEQKPAADTRASNTPTENTMGASLTNIDSIDSNWFTFILSVLLPSFALPWGLLQLGLLSNQAKRAQGLCLIYNEVSSYETTTLTDCHPYSIWSIFAYYRLGSILLGLVCSILLSSLAICLLDDSSPRLRAWLNQVKELLGSSDSSNSNRLRNGHSSNNNNNNSISAVNPASEPADVLAERNRVEGTLRDGAEDPIAVINLHKHYLRAGKSDHSSSLANASNLFTDITVALDRLTFGVRERECFGLLGENGAGKTSCLSILAGSESADGGEALLDGHSVVKRSATEVYHKLGFTPQFDALCEALTGREQLLFYGGIKAIPAHKLSQLIDYYVGEFELTAHVDKLIENYSGGSKRKLSVIISLLGSPNILLLDEPSSGMDISARRNMWNIINDELINNNRSSILTTHSLEEAEVLCNNIGILSAGKLQCIGTPLQLKQRHGSGYEIQIRLNSSKDTALLAIQREAIKLFMNQLMEKLRETYQPNNAVLPQNNSSSSNHLKLMLDCGNILSFNISNSFAFNLSCLFAEMYANKAALNIAEYSISQCNLEQVFLKFAQSQEVINSSSP
jgi:ATP-binding cassette subfamily A (ABC1) protein 3